jgi:hypothetical protein
MVAAQFKLVLKGPSFTDCGKNRCCLILGGAAVHRWEMWNKTIEVPEGRPTIARRFSAGSGAAKEDQVPEGRLSHP